MLFGQEKQGASGSKTRRNSWLNKTGFLCPLPGTDGKGKYASFSYAVAGT